MARPGVHIALLRGINVGGKNKLPMAKLRDIFEAVGAEEVQTYIQSGNVVFRSRAALAKQIPSLVSAAILAQQKLTVPVQCRSLAVMKTVAATHPLAQPGDEARLLHVLFLARAPTKTQAARLSDNPSPQDSFALRGKHLYVRYAKGAGSTKLTNAWIDRRLETVSTARNWRTVQKLLELGRG